MDTQQEGGAGPAKLTIREALSRLDEAWRSGSGVKSMSADERAAISAALKVAGVTGEEFALMRVKGLDLDSARAWPTTFRWYAAVKRADPYKRAAKDGPPDLGPLIDCLVEERLSLTTEGRRQVADLFNRTQLSPRRGDSIEPSLDHPVIDQPLAKAIGGLLGEIDRKRRAGHSPTSSLAPVGEWLLGLTAEVGTAERRAIAGLLAGHEIAFGRGKGHQLPLGKTSEDAQRLAEGVTLYRYFEKHPPLEPISAADAYANCYRYWEINVINSLEWRDTPTILDPNPDVARWVRRSADAGDKPLKKPAVWAADVMRWRHPEIVREDYARAIQDAVDRHAYDSYRKLKRRRDERREAALAERKMRQR